jgi:hypothetical protein
MTTQPMPREPHEGLKADAGAEAQAGDRDQSSYVARAGQSSGTVASGPEPGDEQPSQAVDGGTAGGDPLAGVTASARDVEDAVSGDTGPEHPGRHG